jgi:hypothetical protein
MANERKQYKSHLCLLIKIAATAVISRKVDELREAGRNASQLASKLEMVSFMMIYNSCQRLW